jgi:CopA family copper-resistance protein
MRTSKTWSASGITRRQFVQGLIAGGVIASVDLQSWPALGVPTLNRQAVLTGTHFDLAIEEVTANFTGRTSVATAINGSVPGPVLRWREGDTVTIAVTNRLREPTSVHWHGVRSPSDMDGVPGLSFPGIAPGETFVYRIPVRQSGTYWYHSHSGFQEQTGHYAPLIIERRGKDQIEFNREYVVLLSDWTDTNAHTLFSNLKQQSDYYNFRQRTVATFISDVKKEGFGPTLSDRLMWGEMNMSPTDILDVSGATYTYLLNGQPPAANWTAIFQPSERVRLRFINGSSMSIFDVRIPGLPMAVVQADGNDVEPVTVDEFRISVAETYDVIVQPKDSSPFTIFAQAMDRTGYARGTLAPRPGMTAAIPPMDPRPMRTMADMGMGKMQGMNMPGMSESSSITSAPGSSLPSSMGDMGDTPGMKMGPSTGQPSSHGAEPMENMVGMEMEGEKPPLAIQQARLRPVNPVQLHLGPEVDNIATGATEQLSTPGIGLDGNGRRVLTYADLRARYRGTDLRMPEREFEFHLTGNMQRFIWGFNGKRFSENEPVQLRLGERVRFVLINDTMMEHPIHLHGLWSELENGHGEFRPYKHTVNVKPAERLSFLVSADTTGRWAFHCHLLYHMEAGMFLTVVVS